MIGAPETLPCIREDCDRVIPPEEDHVRIEGHLINTDDRDRQDTFYAHQGCWRQITEDWPQP